MHADITAQAALEANRADSITAQGDWQASGRGLLSSVAEIEYEPAEQHISSPFFLGDATTNARKS